jgi:hypothetical protein
VTPQPAGQAIRYRVVVYEISDDHETTVMDATATGFIAAAASLRDGEMDLALGDGGPHALIQHIGLFIAGQYPA